MKSGKRMKKKDAVNILQEKLGGAYNATSIKKTQDDIRALADSDEGFGNVVFELGCSVLAKALITAENKKKSENTL